MPYTGADYAEAASKKIDWPTASHMRYALFAVLKKWHNTLETEQTPERARALFAEMPLKDPILIKAGTAHIVSEYYKDLVSHIPDENLQNCLNSVQQEDIDNISAGLEKGKHWAMLKAALKFSSLSKEYLHVETVTDSYQSFLKTHKAQLATVPMLPPQGYTTKEIDQLDGDQKLFNLLDKMDITHASVRQKNVPFNAESERSFNSVLPITANLREGTQIANSLEVLQDWLETKASLKTITTPAQAKAVAQDVEDAIMCVRTAAKPQAAGEAYVRAAFEHSVKLHAGDKLQVTDSTHNDISAPAIRKPVKPLERH